MPLGRVGGRDSMADLLIESHKLRQSGELKSLFFTPAAAPTAAPTADEPHAASELLAAAKPRPRAQPLRAIMPMLADEAHGGVDDMRPVGRPPNRQAFDPRASAPPTLDEQSSIRAEPGAGDGAPQRPPFELPHSDRQHHQPARTARSVSISETTLARTRLRTLGELGFCETASDGGRCTQIGAEAVALLHGLVAASEEASGRRPAASVTTLIDPRAPTVADSFLIPADLRDAGCALRQHKAAEARRSHEKRPGLEDERAALEALVREVVADGTLADKPAQAGANNPVVALLHNCLVRVRRYHRLLEDTEDDDLDDEAVDAAVAMLGFCTAVILECGRSALYNQAVKHVGEFFAYRYASPPVLERAATDGAVSAAVRDSLLALYALLAKGSALNDSSRAAVREALRCAACSAAPPQLLLEASVEPMLRLGAQRDDAATRAREMGLTTVYLVLARAPWPAVRGYFESAEQALQLKSKLHGLIGLLGAARADAAKSALSKQLAALVMGCLGATPLAERLVDAVTAAELEAAIGAELLRHAGLVAEFPDSTGPAGALAPAAGAPRSARQPRGASFRDAPTTAEPALGAKRPERPSPRRAQFASAAAQPRASRPSPSRAPLGSPGRRRHSDSTAARDGSGAGRATLTTLVEPMFFLAAGAHSKPITQIEPEALALLEALPASAEEANARRPAAAVTAAAAEGGGRASQADVFVIPSNLRAPAESLELGLRRHRAAEARGAHEVRARVGDERAALIALIQSVSEEEALWEKKAQGGVNNPVVALLHNCLVRIRRYHRLLEDACADPLAAEHGRVDAASAESVDAAVRMLDFCTVVISESGRSALYNQAVKHVGEFFAYRYASPPVLELAGVERRQGRATTAAVLRDALLALYALLAKGSALNDSSRAAVREALRCAACSAAPPQLLLEASVEPMLRLVKQRDDFAVRAREMGLTTVYLVLARAPWPAVRGYLEGADRTLQLKSKLHGLIGVLGAARADAAKSALNKQLAALVMGCLGATPLAERLVDVVKLAELEAAVGAELLRHAGLTFPSARADGPPAQSGGGLGAGKRASSAQHLRRPGQAVLAGLRVARLLADVPRAATADGVVAGVGPRARAASTAPRLQRFAQAGGGSLDSGEPTGRTLDAELQSSSRTARLERNGTPLSRAPSGGTDDNDCNADDRRGGASAVDAASVALLEALPRAAAEVDEAPLTACARDADLEAALARLDGNGGGGGGGGERGALALDLDDEMAGVLALVEQVEAFWVADADDAELIAQEVLVRCLLRIRRCHRLCERERREPSQLRARAHATMLDFVSRLLTRHDDALAARRHALAHAAEHFRSAYATRGLLAPLQPSVAGASKCGQAAAQAPLVRSLFKLLATADGEGAAAARAGARDGLRAAACSQLPMEALVEPAIEALERALEEASRLPAAGELAVVESALTCLLLALSRDEWSEAVFDWLSKLATLSAQDATMATAGTLRLDQLARALRVASARACESELVAELVRRVLAELASTLGEAATSELLADVAGRVGGGGERAETDAPAATPADADTRAPAAPLLPPPPTVRAEPNALRGRPNLTIATSSAGRVSSIPLRRSRVSSERPSTRRSYSHERLHHSARCVSSPGGAVPPAPRSDGSARSGSSLRGGSRLSSPGGSAPSFSRAGSFARSTNGRERAGSGAGSRSSSPAPRRPPVAHQKGQGASGDNAGKPTARPAQTGLRAGHRVSSASVAPMRARTAFVSKS